MSSQPSPFPNRDCYIAPQHDSVREGCHHGRCHIADQQQELFLLVAPRLPADAAVRPAVRGAGRLARRSGEPGGAAAAIVVDPDSRAGARGGDALGRAGDRGIFERGLPQGEHAAARPIGARLLPLDRRRDACRVPRAAWRAADEPAAVPAGIHRVVGGAGRYQPDCRNLAGMPDDLERTVAVRQAPQHCGCDVCPGGHPLPHLRHQAGSGVRALCPHRHGLAGHAGMVGRRPARTRTDRGAGRRVPIPTLMRRARGWGRARGTALRPRWS